MSVPEPDDIDYASALTPFSADEHKRLRRYVRLAERLAKCSFFERTPSFKFEAGFPEGDRYEMGQVPNDDDEAIDAMYLRLRVLYEQGRPTAASYPNLANLLSRHGRAKGGPEAEKLLALLRDIKQNQRRAATTGVGISISTESRSADGKLKRRKTPPREMFEDWLYGEHLHDDEDRLARIDTFRSGGLHQFTALHVATELSNVYIAVARNLVVLVLADLSLFPAE